MEKHFRKVFFILGGLLLFAFFDSTIVFLRAGSFNWTSVFLDLSGVFMVFALGFLYPHLKTEDERAKAIKYQAGFYSIIAIMIQMIILMIGTFTGFFYLESEDLLRLIMALVTITFFSFELVFAKKL